MRKWIVENFCEKKYAFERKVENFHEIRKFLENFERILRISRKIFNENFYFRSLFCCLNEIFAKEIESKFETSNPSSLVKGVKETLII